MHHSVFLHKFQSLYNQIPQKLVEIVRIYVLGAMLYLRVLIPILAQEPAITPLPPDKVKSPPSQSNMLLAVQVGQNGNSYLNWTMVPPTQGPAPVNSDIEWLVSNLKEGIESPLLMPAAPIPQPQQLHVRSIDISGTSPHKLNFQVQGRLPTAFSIPHKVSSETGNCLKRSFRESFDIADGFPTHLFVSKMGTCDVCKEKPLKDFIMQEGRYNISFEENFKYGERVRQFGATGGILYQILDKTGNKLTFKYEERDYNSNRAYNLDTYNGGNYLRIIPLTFQAEDRLLLLNRRALFEDFSTYKEIAGLAYSGRKGDKAFFYLDAPTNSATDNIEVTRELPWSYYRFEPHPLKFNKLEAEIVEVIEGPPHQPDLVNWFLPEYFPYFLGLDDDYSPFKKSHPYCGVIPTDYRAVILRTKPINNNLTTYILGIKGSEFNRSDWIYTDIPQYFGAIPEQYKFSKKVADYVSTMNHHGQPLKVTGHSLGGGMAQYIVGTNSSWSGYGFNPATLGTGISAEIASPDNWSMARFNVIQNSNDIVSNAGGKLLGNIWVLEAPMSSYLVAGHTLGSMDLSRILTVLPAPSKNFSLNSSTNLAISSPPLLPGFVNQQFANLPKP